MTIFLTGFPGFLGSALVERLLDRTDADTKIVCLIQKRWRGMAEQRAFAIERKNTTRLGRIELVEGDITRPGLGLGEHFKALQESTVEVYHLAAVYDLSVKRDFAFKVNVEGTRNVLDFAEGCAALQRFQYVSTCYVSGKYNGTFGENDLEKGQAFNNFYEETKYLAEIEVQNRMKAGFPATIYRPGIVVGDSHTGSTQKYDGPYMLLMLMLRQWSLAIVPTIGDTKAITVNLVPQDFVIDAIAYLSSIEASKGKVYQLANPKPPTVQQLLDLFARHSDRFVVQLPVPHVLARTALEYVPFAQDILGITPDAMDYFIHPTTYTCDNTLADLKDSTIACPPLKNYIGTLVDFVRKNPNISADAMV